MRPSADEALALLWFRSTDQQISSTESSTQLVKAEIGFSIMSLKFVFAYAGFVS